MTVVGWVFVQRVVRGLGLLSLGAAGQQGPTPFTALESHR